MPESNNRRETAVVVPIDEQGRVTIPKPARKALGLHGQAGTVDVTVAHPPGGAT